MAVATTLGPPSARTATAEFCRDPQQAPSPSSPASRAGAAPATRRHVAPARVPSPSSSPSPLPSLSLLPPPCAPHTPGEVRRRRCRCSHSSSAPILENPGPGTFENNWKGIRVRVRALRLSEDRAKGPGWTGVCRGGGPVPCSWRELLLRRATCSLAHGAERSSRRTGGGTLGRG